MSKSEEHSIERLRLKISELRLMKLLLDLWSRFITEDPQRDSKETAHKEDECSYNIQFNILLDYYN
jgi:hypothetical protein